MEKLENCTKIHQRMKVWSTWEHQQFWVDSTRWCSRPTIHQREGPFRNPQTPIHSSPTTNYGTGRCWDENLRGRDPARRTGNPSWRSRYLRRNWRLDRSLQRESPPPGTACQGRMPPTPISTRSLCTPSVAVTAEELDLENKVLVRSGRKRREAKVENKGDVRSEAFIDLDFEICFWYFIFPCKILRRQVCYQSLSSSVYFVFVVFLSRSGTRTTTVLPSVVERLEY